MIISYYCIGDDFVAGSQSIILKFVKYEYEYTQSHTSIYIQWNMKWCVGYKVLYILKELFLEVFIEKVEMHFTLKIIQVFAPLYVIECKP